jgi:aspartyl protease family protein
VFQPGHDLACLDAFVEKRIGARRLCETSLPLEFLSYSVPVETANGRTRAAPVTLDKVAIGSIVERNIPALIAQPGQLRTSLLGMSFLNRLASSEVRGDRLVLRRN